MLHQKRSGKLARLKYLLAIPICGGLLCASTLAFSKTYGWVDIAPHHIYSDNVDPQTHVAKDTDKTHVPPPPPPAPPVKRVTFPLPKPLPNKTAKGYRYSESAYLENGKYDITVTCQEKNGSLKYFSKSTATPADLTLLKDKYGYVFPAHLRMPPTIRPTVHELPATPAQPTVKELPQPPPPAPPKPATYTKKGYKYSEDGYLIDGKTDFRVIIFEKNGNQLAFFKSKASFDDLNLLKEKYGYTFPLMDIHSKMPPPPPTAPVKADSKNTKQINRDEAPENITLNGITLTSKRPANYIALNPLIIINGVKYYTIGKTDAHHMLSWSASDSSIVYKNDKMASEKLGPDAKNGAFYLYGKVELTVLDHGNTAN